MDFTYDSPPAQDFWLGIVAYSPWERTIAPRDEKKSLCDRAQMLL